MWSQIKIPLGKKTLICGIWILTAMMIEWRCGCRCVEVDICGHLVDLQVTVKSSRKMQCSTFILLPTVQYWYGIPSTPLFIALWSTSRVQRNLAFLWFNYVSSSITALESRSLRFSLIAHQVFLWVYSEILSKRTHLNSIYKGELGSV